MGLFRWLLGALRPSRPQFDWQPSENGNPTLLHEGVRFTLLSQDGWWKFAMADAIDEKHEPFLSGRYRTQDEAKTAAVAVILDNS